MSLDYKRVDLLDPFNKLVNNRSTRLTQQNYSNKLELEPKTKKN